MDVVAEGETLDPKGEVNATADDEDVAREVVADLAAVLDFLATDAVIDVGSSATATLEDVGMAGVILVEDCSGAATA